MKALVLGGAVSGRAAIGLLDRLDAEYIVYDQHPAAVEDLATEGVEVATGDWDPALLEAIDVVVASPGFAPSSPPIVSAGLAGVPIWNEVELALRHLDCPIIAVTGTNGKTTVVELITAMLERAGLAVAAAGNIGRPLSEVALQKWDAVVLELSSFQLARIDSLEPRVAVVLNVAPDHLDWHGSFEHYRASKARIFANLADHDLLIYDFDDEGASSLVVDAPGRKTPVSGVRIPSGGFGIGPHSAVLAGGEIPLDDLPVDDPSYRMDLVASAVAAFELGADFASIAGVFRAFETSAHRRTVVGVWNGVVWINDSKATNPHSAVAAIRSYPSVVLIAGGRNKGLDLSPLATASNVRVMVAIGESAAELLAARGDLPARRAGSLEQAIGVADAESVEGDTVLLSPGCASFDMFENYRERGDAFTRIVRRRHQGAA